MRTKFLKRDTGLLCLLLWAISFQGEAQTARGNDEGGIDFSAVIQISSNGISTVPAFSLGKPAILGTLFLKKDRFTLNQQVALSIEGQPWYFESSLNYHLIDWPKFDFKPYALSGVSFNRSTVVINGHSENITEMQRYIFLNFPATYKLSDKLSLVGTTFHGYGFKDGAIEWATFLSLSAGIGELKLWDAMFLNLKPELLYINLDWATEGYFMTAWAGINHKKLPIQLSTQFIHYHKGNITPNPGLQWNVGLTFDF